MNSLDNISRPSMIEVMMMVAKSLSLRSTCIRLHVGCIITNEDMTSIVGLGFNGYHKGAPHIPESTEPGKSGTIHAEVNALIKTDFNIKNKKLFVTHSPCMDCAKLIINAGICEVYYGEEYRDKEPINLLKKAGIKVYGS